MARQAKNSGSGAGAAAGVGGDGRAVSRSKAAKKKAASNNKSAPKRKAAKRPEPKSTRGRRGHVTRPTLREEIAILERQDLVFELYKSGASIRKISDHLASKGYENVSKTTVHRDLLQCIARMRETLEISARDEAAAALATLSDLQMAFYVPATRDRNVDAGKLVIQILRERDRIVQYSKAQQADTDAKQALAKLLGVDPEEIPDGSDDAGA